MLSLFRNTIPQLALLLFPWTVSAEAQDLELIVTGIRSKQGEIVIGIYRDEASFRMDQPFLRKKFDKSGMQNGVLKIPLSLAPGTYGMALLDDENRDDKMNFSFFGVPKEGYGFSNYVLTGLTRPRFDSVSFTVVKGTEQKIICKIEYM